MTHYQDRAGCAHQVVAQTGAAVDEGDQFGARSHVTLIALVLLFTFLLGASAVLAVL